MASNYRALTNKMDRPLIIWERENSRKIYGPLYENGYWRIKMNYEICIIVTVFKVCRL